MKLTTILNKLNKDYNMKRKVTELTELTPNNGRASFYGKAHSGYLKVGKEYYKVCKSYNTYVAIVKCDNRAFTFTEHSNTTTTHIKAFLYTRKTLAELREKRAK